MDLFLVSSLRSFPGKLYEYNELQVLQSGEQKQM